MHARRRNEKNVRVRAAGLALALALLITPELFASNYFYVDDATAPLASLSDLAQEFIVQRDVALPPYPPDIGLFIHSDGMSVLASLDEFPAAFCKGLIGADRCGLYGYAVTCIQIRGLDSIIFLNADGNVIGTVPYTDDSIWNRTAWSDDGYDTDLRLTDPARVGLTLNLVTPDELAAAEEAAELQAEIDAASAFQPDSSSGGLLRLGGMQRMDSMQSLLDDTYTNLIFAGIQWVTNGVELTIGLPDGGWTNRLDLLVSDDLGPFLWRWRARLDDATNGVSFTWVDTNAPTIDRTFYLLGNVEIDSDGDNLSDAMEIYVTKTCPTNSDTDGDGVTDGDALFSGLPLMVGFETTEGYAAGSLNGQKAWQSPTTNQVVVQAEVSKNGCQAFQMPGIGTLLNHPLVSTSSVVTAETWLYWSPGQGSVVTNLPASASALVSFDPEQGIVAFNGNGNGGGTWVTVPGTTIGGEWVHLKIAQDFAAQSWHLWVNDVDNLGALGFKDNGVTRVHAVHFQDGTCGPLYGDDLRVEAQP